MWCVDLRSDSYTNHWLAVNLYKYRVFFPKAPLPDTYHGTFREDHPNPGQAYANTVRDLIEQVHKKGRKVDLQNYSKIKVRTGLMYCQERNVNGLISIFTGRCLLCGIIAKCWGPGHLAPRLFPSGCRVSCNDYFPIVCLVTYMVAIN